MSPVARILIAGGGVGGLALALALRRGDLDVVVYEQDPTPEIRNQGYRIHIDSNGNDALRACLPADVLDLVRNTSGINGDLVATYTHRLEPATAQTFPGIPGDEITNVDRNTFRTALLTGLNDRVHFGRTLVGYRVTDSGRVRVRLADGGYDEADMLIGADGVGSAVRRQLLPHAVVKDVGLRCIYGRMAITEATEGLIPEDFNRGLCWVPDDTGCGAGFAPMRFRSRPEGTWDYLMITLLATAERLGSSDDELLKLPPENLKKLTLRATAEWHPALRDLFAHGDSDTFFPITIRTSERVAEWDAGPVTLLGDAIHTMPPTAGVGANTALRDAATLADEILSAVRGHRSLVDAVAAYECVMRPRGFDAVDNSLQMVDRMFGNVPDTARQPSSTSLPPRHACLLGRHRARMS